MGALCPYASSLILRWSEGFEDFSDMCAHYLGAWAWHLRYCVANVLLLCCKRVAHALLMCF